MILPRRSLFGRAPRGRVELILNTQTKILKIGNISVRNICQIFLVFVTFHTYTDDACQRRLCFYNNSNSKKGFFQKTVKARPVLAGQYWRIA